MPNRIIKQDLNRSESLAQCTIGANMLFPRLWTYTDDHGCFDARVKILRGNIFPLMMDKVRESDIEKWLNELQSVDCLRLWTHEKGVRYGYIPNFSEHQPIRSIHKRITPEPPQSIILENPVTSAFENICKQVQASENKCSP